MRRVPIQPRPDWRTTIQSQGYLYHESRGIDMWNESVYYELTDFDVDTLETATNQLLEMYIAAGQHVIDNNLLAQLQIPAYAHDLVRTSWNNSDAWVYGRFDLAYDGAGPPRLLEFNADTPTTLLEAAIIQWYWFQDQFPGCDQFNSLHERLIGAWKGIAATRARLIHFACTEDCLEDYMTVSYMRDLATQAGAQTEFIEMGEIGWNDAAREFRDLREKQIKAIFKLYPWEWMMDEDFGRQVVRGFTAWIEPPWKMLWSNKGLLPILYELFPDSPYILRASYQPFACDHIAKPIHSREGANISVVQGGKVTQQTDGPYHGPCIYQERVQLPCFDGRYPVVGSWLVAGYSAGVGIREDATPITTNTSQFIPHLYISNK